MKTKEPLKFKTREQLYNFYLQAAEEERKQVALQMKIDAGLITPSGKPIIRPFPKSLNKN